MHVEGSLYPSCIIYPENGKFQDETLTDSKVTVHVQLCHASTNVCGLYWKQKFLRTIHQLNFKGYILYDWGLNNDSYLI